MTAQDILLGRLNHKSVRVSDLASFINNPFDHFKEMIAILLLSLSLEGGYSEDPGSVPDSGSICTGKSP